MDKFKGTGVALVTPFNENGKVDYNGLQKLVEFQINNGTNYLVVQGTTGESVTLLMMKKLQY
jgi:4-hydroxy-tetrahydrodipicolinate synthase